MKKGAVGTIIGIIFFMFAVEIIFTSDGMFNFFSVVPFIFIIIFAIIVPLVVKKVKETQDQANERIDKFHHYNDSKYGSTLSTKTNCHKCKSVIDKSYKYCPYCGASQRDTIICEYCGHENPKENALCEKCNGFL